MKIWFSSLLLCFATLLSGGGTAFAQSEVSKPAPEEKRPTAKNNFWDKVYVGGGLGLSFGTYTNIRVAPLVGYELTDNLSAGIGGQYIYFKDKTYSPAFSTDIYGGSVFTRFNFLENFFVMGEFEVLNLENFDNYGTPDYTPSRVNVPALLLGGGISQRTPQGSGFFLGIFFDAIQDPNSPYLSGPIIRVGGFFGL